jgi:hypothetical protein
MKLHPVPLVGGPFRLALPSVVFVALAPVILASQPAQAQENRAGARPKCLSVSGVLLRQAFNGSWHAIKAGDSIPVGPLVCLPKAEILSADGAIKLSLLADVGQRGPFPVLEAGVAVTDGPGDLDVTLDRGIMTLENVREEGKAQARVSFLNATWTVTLNEPGSKVGLELYARFPPGLPNLMKGKMADPVTEVYLIVIKGSVFVEDDHQGFRVVAPPGPAVVQWDSLFKNMHVRHLDKLPDFALNAEEKKLSEKMAAAASRLAQGNIDKALDGLLASDQKVDRLVGVTLSGALSDLLRVKAGLEDPRHADTRDHAVLVARHWLGRGPGQVARLYQAMKRQPGYSEVQARNAVQMLFGFNERERADPATYELLIHNLDHPRPAIRELARWHLVRLAPAGKKIMYDAAASPEERQRAQKEWQALIPPGEVPVREVAPQVEKK